MISAKVDTKELQRVLKKLNDAVGEVRKKGDIQIEASARRIERNAKREVPVNMGRLKSSIDVRGNNLEREVYTDVKYAPYVEFGTGSHASEYLSDKSQEMRNYAMQFYKNGKGRMPSKPYLFPAFESEKPKLLKNLKKVIRGIE